MRIGTVKKILHAGERPDFIGRAVKSCGYASGRQMQVNKLEEKEPGGKRGPVKTEAAKNGGQSSHWAVGHPREASEDLSFDRAASDPI